MGWTARCSQCAEFDSGDSWTPGPDLLLLRRRHDGIPAPSVARRPLHPCPGPSRSRGTPPTRDCCPGCLADAHCSSTPSPSAPSQVPQRWMFMYAPDNAITAGEGQQLPAGAQIEAAVIALWMLDDPTRAGSRCSSSSHHADSHFPVEPQAVGQVVIPDALGVVPVRDHIVLE
jgi:hypothetical protein